MSARVRWTVTKTAAAPCPDRPRVDPYTGETDRFAIRCGVLHYEEKTWKMWQEFGSLSAAQAFIDGAPDSCSEWEITTDEHGGNKT